MLKLLFLAIIFSHFLYTKNRLAKNLHVLQLNSYRNKRYFSWFCKHPLSLFLWRDLIPLSALIPLFFRDLNFSIWIFVSIYLVSFFIKKEKKEKKPLIFTSRAKRLYIFSLIFMLGFYALLYGFFWHGNFYDVGVAIISLVLFTFCSAFLIFVANFLLLPLESAINHWYFCDARKIIRSMPNLKVIGITGSFGKTTTKHVLNAILSKKYNTLMPPGSYNTPMGIAKIIRSELKPIHEIFIVEMSAKQRGDIKEICDLVHPCFGILTAIGEQHLDTFGNFENVKKTKNELIESLPQNGVAFFNYDDINCRELAKLTDKKSIFYGSLENEVDCCIKEIKAQSFGSSFVVSYAGLEVGFKTKLLGRHNVQNILAAISCAAFIGVKLQDMIFPVQQLLPVQHRLEIKKIGGDIIYIDDAFNSNPVGCMMALEVLSEIPATRKIIVTPGLVDLGDREDALNKQFGEGIADVCDYVILVGKRKTEAIASGLIEKKYPMEKCYTAYDFSDANKHLQSILKPKDVVLFENDLPTDY